MQWDSADIARVIGAKTILTDDISGISTDTRTVKSGELFLALSGDQFDGHEYVSQALGKGAKAAIVEHPLEGVPDEKLMIVENTRTAYYQLAAAYRDSLPIPIIGITGSVGKTSVKEMVAAALSMFFPVHKTAENLNNELGVCQTILSIPETAGAAVVEMGIDHPGDMDLLTGIVRPDMAVVTGIGISHLEIMGSRERLFQEKMAISEGMKSSAPLILNGDNDMLAEITNWKTHPVLRYSFNNSAMDISATNITENVDDFTTTFTVCTKEKKYPVSIPTLGNASIENALAACGVLLTLNLSLEKGVEGLKNYEPVGMRQRIVSASGVTVIEDCYNASPTSMNAAIEVLCHLKPTGRRIAVLGDMLELGIETQQHHEALGKLVAAENIDRVYFTGNFSKEAFAAAKKAGMEQAFWIDSVSNTAERVAKELESGDIVLLKASRGLRLEQVAEAIYQKYPKEK